METRFYENLEKIKNERGIRKMIREKEMQKVEEEKRDSDINNGMDPP